MAAPWWVFAVTFFWGTLAGWLGMSVRILRRRVATLETRPTDADLQLDLATVVGRLEQVAEYGHDSLAGHRLVSCDLPRLRGHLSDETLEMMDRYR